ncbi:MAG TPA: hydroxymethylbilane synthase [Acidimicrobiales bacterium]|nr:hydroxymethylbilane synthase [Acidimicrobiales bacterium]
MTSALRLATRGSPLALEQARRVQARLAAFDPTLPTELVVVESEGDRRPGAAIHALGGAGVFVAEIERAVLERRADVAVHSLKDLPSSAPPDGLVLAATPERLDARDALVGRTLAQLAPGALIATGAVRRRAQLAWLRPDLCFIELRGAIATRLCRVPPGGAAVVAVAALERLGLGDRAAEVLSTEVMVPQVGQGALGLRCRADDAATIELLAAIDDPAVARAIAAERAFLRRIGGGCDAPVGAHATCESSSDPVVVDGFIAREDGHALVRRTAQGDDPVAVGTALAEQLLFAEGARSFVVPPAGGRPDRPGGARRPLVRWRVVVTRAAAQASSLVAALEARGAEVIELATIAVADPGDGGVALREAAGRMATFDWIVFTSENAVERLFAAIPGVRTLGGVRVAAIGPGTADALRRRGVRPDLLPRRFVGEALVAEFPPGIPGGRVLLPRAAVARAVVPDGLRRLGWHVEVVEAYRTVPAAASAAALARAAGADAITFTSPSTVRGYCSLGVAGGVPPVVVSIGPVTSAAARAAGLTVTVEADVHSVDGLVNALVAWTVGHPRPPAG